MKIIKLQIFKEEITNESITCKRQFHAYRFATYWNQVYGAQPEQISEDREGLMTMYSIGKNMAWVMNCLELGKEHGLIYPENEKVLTNFIK